MEIRISYMRIIKCICCFVVLNVSLWLYSETILGQKNNFVELLSAWTVDFDKFDTVCIHWIAMRIVIWLYILWKMLWLEQSFMLYLFIRERNYKKMFIRQYGKCIMGTAVYFGVQFLSFAVMFCQNGARFSDVLWCFGQKELWEIFLNETVGALNLCLLIYLLYCMFQKAEISFLVVLGMRLLLGFTVGGITKNLQISLMSGLALNGVLFIIVMNQAGANFYDRVQGEA